MNMPKIERRRAFLDLAKIPKRLLSVLRDDVVNTQFVDLSDDLYEKVHALYEKHNRYMAIYLVRDKLVIIIF
jgi:hypothetical protein